MPFYKRSAHVCKSPFALKKRSTFMLLGTTHYSWTQQLMASQRVPLSPLSLPSNVNMYLHQIYLSVWSPGSSLSLHDHTLHYNVNLDCSYELTLDILSWTKTLYNFPKISASYILAIYFNGGFLSLFAISVDMVYLYIYSYIYIYIYPLLFTFFIKHIYDSDKLDSVVFVLSKDKI